MYPVLKSVMNPVSTSTLNSQDSSPLSDTTRPNTPILDNKDSCSIKVSVKIGNRSFNDNKNSDLVEQVNLNKNQTEIDETKRAISEKSLTLFNHYQIPRNIYFVESTGLTRKDPLDRTEEQQSDFKSSQKMFVLQPRHDQHTGGFSMLEAIEIKNFGDDEDTTEVEKQKEKINVHVQEEVEVKDQEKEVKIEIKEQDEPSDLSSLEIERTVPLGLEQSNHPVEAPFDAQTGLPRRGSIGSKMVECCITGCVCLCVAIVSVIAYSTALGSGRR